jgi:hypothetical protein
MAPETPGSFIVNVGGSYLPNRDMVIDTEGESSNSICESASLTYVHSTDFISVPDGLTLAVEPTKISHLGGHTVTVTKYDAVGNMSGNVPNLVTDVTITVEADCSLFGFGNAGTNLSMNPG